MPDFSHLHVHSQFSLLDGASDIDHMMEAAKEDGMNAMAITDHGNMFGVPKFTFTAQQHGIKPIIGCEFYLTPSGHQDRSDPTRYHQLILAKNKQGYHNLAKLCSRGFTHGYYYKPRIDKDLIRQYSEGLIATTCCLAAEVPQLIINHGEEKAEEAFKEWLDIFGDDFYIELQRHGIREQDIVNEVLVKWAKKHNVRMIATNDVHYIDEKDSKAQDILLCLQTGKEYDDPDRLKFDNSAFYLKRKQEMAQLFSDIPEALDNTQEIVDKIDTPDLKRDILLPVYTLPEGFETEGQYLRHLTYEGAKRKYGEVTEAVRDRIEHELGIINSMGFDGYFLIVQDFIKGAHDLNVRVGPGRGSAAGSVVAYCTDITDVDPIRYDLIFERFLNPERVNMPDIDIDFDDAGRQSVIDWVVEKYGYNQVAHIVTYGTMAARSAIRDVARVLKVPLADADKMSKKVPEGTDLKQSLMKLDELQEFLEDENSQHYETIEMADTLKGSVRHTGLHAAGIIVAPDDLKEYIPVFTSKDTNLLITQYDMNYVEDVGMLKMDFLGLKTLTIIENAVQNVEKSRGEKIDIDHISFSDPKAFELYQKGETVGTFQFESEGMRAYLRQIQPENIDDLIAMNALYRPGPMDYIPEFIDRKHGKKEVDYPHPWLEDILKPTYGIMVYQEQIMQAAQIIGGFSLGKADILRRAMGKKKMKEMEKMKEDFISGAQEKGIDKAKAEEVFGIMEKFANYGFNRSHASAYSMIAYQTGYLKANYPPEFMAAVLANNMEDIKKINFFIEECSRMGIRVLGPNVNESDYYFMVNSEGEIRFGMGAIKGVGESAVMALVEERRANGPFQNIFDLTSRTDLRKVNRKALESLAMAGAFDCFDNMHRQQYLANMKEGGPTVIEEAMRYGQRVQQSKVEAKQSLFAGLEDDYVPEPPTLPEVPAMDKMEQLKQEKELIGFYISGHPLDDYKLDLDAFCTCSIAELEDYKGKQVKIGGIITKTLERKDKNGNKFGIFSVEDFSGVTELRLFKESYLKFQHLIVPEQTVMVKGFVQNKFNQENEVELKVQELKMLSSVREEESKELILKLPVNELTEETVDTLEGLAQQHKGQCKLKIELEDQEEEKPMRFSSTGFQVDPNNDLFTELDKMQGISYHLR